MAAGKPFKEDQLEAPLRQLGEELFRAVFREIGEVYRASMAVARDRGEKLRVVLRLTAPELAAVAWETLHGTVPN